MDQRITTLMADLFGMRREEITDDLTMKQTDNWDSLKHMELIVSLEQTFEIDFTFDEIVAMKTLEDIKGILRDKGIGGEDGRPG